MSGGIRQCAHGHLSLDAANWVCPWCELARLEGLLLSVARVIRGRDGLPCWCDDYDARPDHTHSAKCIEARRIRAQREEGR